jgi:hypothetical protein
MIRELPSLLSTGVVAAWNKPQHCRKQPEAIFSQGDITMYKSLFAVLLVSTRAGFACGYIISPNSYPLLNADHLAAQRLNWQTPLSTKEDQSVVLNVCGTSECNEKHSNMLPSLMTSRQLTDKRLLNSITVFSSRD